ncbi:hypothetical protein [Lutispora sp.]|uniref:hypothetical protein n=1 Tax=Lutispora sp. TaxID=2828727 RepID=UPI0035667B69
MSSLTFGISDLLLINERLNLSDWFQYAGAMLGYVGTVIVSIVAISQNGRLQKLEEQREAAFIEIDIAEEGIEVDSDNCDKWFSSSETLPDGYNYYYFDTYANGRKVEKVHSCIMWLKIKNISEKPIANIEINNLVIKTYGGKIEEHSYKNGYYNFHEIVPKGKESDIFIYFDSDYSGDEPPNFEKPFSEEYFEVKFDCVVTSIYQVTNIQGIEIITNTGSKLINDSFDYRNKQHVIKYIKPTDKRKLINFWKKLAV